MRGEILTVLSCTGQKGENNHSGGERGFSVMQLFINKREVPALIKAIELLIAKEPQCLEAQQLLSRIYECLEKQGKDKTKTNR